MNALIGMVSNLSTSSNNDDHKQNDDYEYYHAYQNVQKGNTDYFDVLEITQNPKEIGVDEFAVAENTIVPSIGSSQSASPVRV